MCRPAHCIAVLGFVFGFREGGGGGGGGAGFGVVKVFRFWFCALVCLFGHVVPFDHVFDWGGVMTLVCFLLAFVLML